MTDNPTELFNEDFEVLSEDGSDSSDDNLTQVNSGYSSSIDKPPKSHEDFTQELSQYTSEFTTDSDNNFDSDEEDESEVPNNYEEEYEKYNLGNLPEHACAYCGIHSPESVVKCNECEKWFCNSRGSTSGGHIINHLVRSRHKTVALHKEGPLGQTSLECFNCGIKNVFLLGFIPAKSESIVVLLCREPCLTLNSLKEMNWDLKQWVPLIKDRTFLSWLVRPPTEKEENRAVKISSSQMAKLEEFWEAGDVNANVEDIARREMEEEVSPVCVRYENSALYNIVYQPLIELEKQYEKKVKKMQAQRGIGVKWGIGVNKHPLLSFQMNCAEGADMRVVEGDEVSIVYPGDVVNKKWSSSGIVIRTSHRDGITVELHNKTSAPVHQSFGFNIEFLWLPVPYNRMASAVKRLHEDDYSVTGFLYYLLLGHSVQPTSLEPVVDNVFKAPGLPTLNDSQNAAVKNSLEQPISLIQGPPGTGKTVTSATLIYHLAKQQRGQILVCAPSNIAVDQLTAKLDQAGLKVVRVASRNREYVKSFVDYLYIHNLTLQLAEKTNDQMFKLKTLWDIQGELSKEDNKKYRRREAELEKLLLQKADVICTTCIGAGALRLAQFRFKQVVIDESTQSTEPGTMIPIVKGAKQIVLIGDHCQLGPVIRDSKAKEAGMERTLFERLIMLGIKPMRLEVQYRMHPCLSEFPSNTFYEGSLQNGVSVEDRRQKEGVVFNWPDPEKPMFFYCSTGPEEFAASGTSYLNRVEAVNVEKLITKMLKSGITPEQIGVITAYEGQRQYLYGNMMRTGSLNKSWYEKIEVANVDAFQGREKDYVILSCVRSNANLGVGFLSDPRRLNVALTRARFGLVVVGNHQVLARQSLWHSLLMHFKKNRLIFEGPLENLTENLERLNEAKMTFHRHNLYTDSNTKGSTDGDYQRTAQNNPGEPEDSDALPDRLPTQYKYVPSKNDETQDKNKGNIRPPAINRVAPNRLPRRSGKDRHRQRNTQVDDPPYSQHYNETQEHNFTQSKASVGDFAESFDDIVTTENRSKRKGLTAATQEDRSSLSQLDWNSRIDKTDFGGSQLGATQSQFEPGTDEGDQEFTQHLPSQMEALQTQPESQLEDDLNQLTVGGYSQELNQMTQSDSDATRFEDSD